VRVTFEIQTHHNFSQIGRMSTSLAGRANTAGHRTGRLVRTARAGKRSKIEWRLKDSGRDAGELCPGASTIVQRECVCVCVCVCVKYYRDRQSKR